MKNRHIALLITVVVAILLSISLAFPQRGGSRSSSSSSSSGFGRSSSSYGSSIRSGTTGGGFGKSGSSYNSSVKSGTTGGGFGRSNSTYNSTPSSSRSSSSGSISGYRSANGTTTTAPNRTHSGRSYSSPYSMGTRPPLSASYTTSNYGGRSVYIYAGGAYAAYPGGPIIGYHPSYAVTPVYVSGGSPTGWIIAIAVVFGLIILIAIFTRPT